MSDEVHTRRLAPASEEGPTERFRCFPDEGVMNRMAEACGCRSPMREHAATRSADLERSKPDAPEDDGKEER